VILEADFAVPHRTHRRRVSRFPEFVHLNLHPVDFPLGNELVNQSQRSLL
jgi:hypothetical protein